MASSRIQLISRKLIKPYFPTPSPLRQHKLSLIDQLNGRWYIPFAFFYSPNKNKNQVGNKIHEIPSLLENSLARTLTSYYPLAGRLHSDPLTIDCSDMGASLIEAHVNCKMSEILQEHDHSINALDDVIFPKGLAWVKPKQFDDSLLVAQLSHFDCGGKALSICMSHRFGDAQTLCNFVRDWALIARNPESSISPKLDASTVFPPIEDPFEPTFGEAKYVTKRYVFDHSSLSQLKAKAAADTGIQDPTRVEVASALLHKCTLNANNAASMANSHSDSKPPIIVQILNLRSFLNPPLSPNYAGNLSYNFNIPMIDEKELSFPRLVSELRRGKVQFYEKYKGITANEFRQQYLSEVEQVRKITTGESPFEMYACSSLCRYPFYHVDFGWGKPERVSLASTPVKNFYILLDDQNGDGLEALVSLDKQAVPVFESDPDLLRFASFRSSDDQVCEARRLVG